MPAQVARAMKRMASMPSSQRTWVCWVGIKQAQNKGSVLAAVGGGPHARYLRLPVLSQRHSPDAQAALYVSTQWMARHGWSACLPHRQLPAPRIKVTCCRSLPVAQQTEGSLSVAPRTLHRGPQTW